MLKFRINRYISVNRYRLQKIKVLPFMLLVATLKSVCLACKELKCEAAAEAEDGLTLPV